MRIAADADVVVFCTRLPSDAELGLDSTMTAALPLPRTPMMGRYVTNEMLIPKTHGPQLWEALGGTELNDYVGFMNWPIISSESEFVGHLNQMTKSGGKRSLIDRLLSRPATSDIYAIVRDGRALGIRAYRSIDLNHRTVESGRVIKSRSLAGTLASLESTYLAMVRAFDECGFRRWESETSAENIAARRSMEKSGLTLEGIARSARQVHGRDCDLARYAITADDWPKAKAAMERKLYQGPAMDSPALAEH
ncbi:GNAT family N-acetyltransferase [Mesorhizobium tianshanense]|nr:GNAT family protein [Mesorhizobium tianshanense]